MIHLALLLAVLIDTSIRPLLPDAFLLRTAPPDLVLLTALYIGFRARRDAQLRWAVMLGVYADLMSVHAIGHFAFLCGVAAYAASRVRRFLPPDPTFAFGVASFFCGVITACFGLILAALTIRHHVGPGFARAVLTAFTSALFAPVVFALWDQSRLFRRSLGGRGYDFA